MAFAIVALGFLIGLVSGATGIGGGTLLAPFMMFVLKIDPFVSVGTDLFVSVITKALGSAIHKRSNNVEMHAMLPLGIAGAAGALFGLAALAFLKVHADIHTSQVVLRRIIGWALCICAAAIAFSARLRSPHGRYDNPWSLGSMGFVVAAITSVTSVGVGSLSVPALYFIKGRTKMLTIVGTSLLYATIVTAVATAGHIVLHDVNYGVAGLLIAGSVPGVALGSTLATRAPSALKPVIVVLLVLSGLRLIA
jgi:uncharacterized membrane protein YfcA